MKKIFMLCVFLLITACGQKIDGTYVSDGGNASFTFKDNGKLVFGSGNSVKETTYSVDGDRIVFNFDGGTPSFFVLNKDGTISLNGFEKYTKKQ